MPRAGKGKLKQPAFRVHVDRCRRISVSNSPTAAGGPVARLRDLTRMLDEGLVDADEFAAAKAAILASLGA